MILKRLELHNFRQFREAELTLHPGVTAIIGSNGSGKTTLLEAITWALYGESRGKRKEDIKPIWGGGEPKVTLEFSIGGRHYFVERDFKTAHLCEVTDGEQVLAERLAPVDAMSERLLKLNYKQFKNSFCAEQKELAFLNLRPEERQQEVAKMLGYDRLRKAAKLAAERKRQISSELKGLQEALQATGTLEADLERARATWQQESGRWLRAKSDLEKSEAALKEMAPRREAAEEAQRLKQHIDVRADHGRQLKKQAEELAKDIDALETKAKRRSELQGPATEYARLEKDREALLAEQARASERVQLEASLTAVQKQADESKKKLASIPDPGLKAAEANLKTASENLSLAVAEAKRAEDAWAAEKAQAAQQAALLKQEDGLLQSELEELEKAFKDGKCATCGQSLPEGPLPKLAALREELKAAQASLKAAEAAETALAARPQALSTVAEALERRKLEEAEAEKNFANARRIAEQRASIQEDTSRRLEEMAQIEEKLKLMPPPFDDAKLETVKQRLAALRPAHEEYMQLASADSELPPARAKLEEARRQFEAERTKQQKAKEKLEELGLNPQQAAEVLSDYAAAKERKDTLSGEVTGYQTSAETAKEAVAKAESGLELHRQAKAKEAQMVADRLLYGELEDGMGQLRVNLIQDVGPRLRALTSDTLASLTGGRYYHAEIDDTYQATLSDDGCPKPVISGGEEDILALALRLVLAQMIQEQSGQPMSLLILDEVFGSLDPERRGCLLERLSGMRELFEQILIISHIEAINEAADRCLNVAYDLDRRESTVMEGTGVRDDLFVGAGA